MKTPLALILGAALLFSGCATDSTGKRTLDPAAMTLIVQTASAAAHNLAAVYLSSGTGKVDYSKALISGALSQVRTLQGTANPVTLALVKEAVGNVITNPVLATATADAAIVTINQGLSQGLTKDSAIETGVSLLDAITQHYAPVAK